VFAAIVVAAREQRESAALAPAFADCAADAAVLHLGVGVSVCGCYGKKVVKNNCGKPKKAQKN